VSDAPSITPSRSAISRILRETAELLELRGENPFRCRAYANGARALEGMLDDPQERYEAGTLAEVKGVGPGLVAGIAEILQTGRLALHEELKAAYPPGIRDLLRLPGLGPKRLRILIDVLQVDSTAALERACAEGRVATLAGFGAKSQEKIVAALASLQRFSERHLLPGAVETAERVRRRLATDPAVRRVEVAGSVRRRLETIGDIDLVAAVAPDAGEADRLGVADRFLTDPELLERIERGPTKSAMLVSGGFRVDLRVVSERQMGSAWLHFTGSKEHNVALRARAKERGWTLNEYGLHEGERLLDEGADEAAIYRRLGFAWIPPEAREGLDEIELAES
jgi:DNA polymerase (family 10)